MYSARPSFGAIEPIDFDGRELVLAAPFELDDRQTSSAKLVHDAHDFALNGAVERMVGNRQLRREAAPSQVVDDVHDLEDHTRPSPARAVP